MDLATLKSWIDGLGYRADIENASTLRVRPREEGVAAFPPFFIQHAEGWVVLSMLDVLGSDAKLVSELPVHLLEANRDMRLAKFAFDEHDQPLLCAELPTESLDQAELADAVERLIQYSATYRRIITGVIALPRPTSG
ncbi:CesT family type III secretion system chaperone [Chondromyces crocatus]|nr:CesT family type III secretion system chaperone [Chondromyces crocatus]